MNPLKPLLIVFSIIFWLSATQAQAATYYVAPAGNNANPGTISQPFATLQKAHDVANPGDTIYMRGGTYTISARTWITRNGSSGNLIKVFNYPGEVPILDAASMTNLYHEVIRVDNTSWWHFKGLEIKNGPDAGIAILNSSSNNIIELCVSHHNARLDNGGKGIAVWHTASNNLILNNDSHHNQYLPSPGGGDGISVGSTGTGNIVRGNRVWRNDDDGIDLFGSTNVLVENNWSWENGYSDSLQPLGNGVGFKLGSVPIVSGGHTIRNNLAWRNKGTGFDVNGATLPMAIFNNTAYENNAANFSFWSAVAHVLKNNLYFDSSTDSALNAAVVQVTNSWNLAVTVSAADFVSLDFSGTAGARNADGSLPTIDFLRLATGSDLIDKGVDVGIVYTGVAPDLGAYEYDLVTPPQPPTVPDPPSSLTVTM